MIIVMNRTLIYSVEDDESIRELLECTMDASGYDVQTFADAESMLAALQRRRCELVLMDIMLPGMDGVEAMKKVKAVYPDMPVIMLSAKGTEISKVKGLDAGADDYMTKPFGILELIARIKARLRKPAVYVCGDISLDDGRHGVTVCGAEIKLTVREYDVLKTLMSRAGSVVSRDELLDRLWGTDFDGETRTVDMHIMSLRTKLGDAGGEIKTVRGVGYMIEKNG